MSWKDKFPKENRYFETENGILYHGDNVDIIGLKSFPEGLVNLIVTSPPYNVGIKYDKYDDKKSEQDYQTFAYLRSRAFHKVLADDGRFAINVPLDTKPKHLNNRIALAWLWQGILTLADLNVLTTVSLVEKNPHRVKYTAWGSYMSASAPYIYNPMEVVLIGYKNQWKRKTKGVSTMSKEEFIKLVSGQWEYRAETKKYTEANFSLDIPLSAIKILTYQDDIVLDPFMGSGTTAVACEQTGRRWIGIELSEEYCEVAKQRILKEIK